MLQRFPKFTVEKDQICCLSSFFSFRDSVFVYQKMKTYETTDRTLEEFLRLCRKNEVSIHCGNNFYFFSHPWSQNKKYYFIKKILNINKYVFLYHFILCHDDRHGLIFIIQSLRKFSAALIFTIYISRGEKKR